MYETIQLFFNEPNARDNFERLEQIVPHAERLPGLDGIHASHINVANWIAGHRESDATHFFLVDGDNWVYENFPTKLDFTPEPDAVYVWRCRNPVNGLVYGYGGVKLLPIKPLTKVDIRTVDMTTSLSLNYKIVDSLISETRYNTSQFDAWRSAFRECVKLSSGIIRNQDARTAERLERWCAVGLGEPFGSWVLDGAREGREYGETHAGDVAALGRINDFDWVYRRYYAFCQKYGTKP